MPTKIEIQLLKPHPDNVKIYGEEDVSDLASEIQQSGWIKPLVVTDFYGGYTIVSGHRRHRAAPIAGYDNIPCEFEQFEHEWQVLDRLLRENFTRDKTGEQKAREFKYRKKVEGEAARQRMSKGGQGVEIFPHLETGKARDSAAKDSGFGTGRTAEKAEKSIDKIDFLIENGETIKAELIRVAVNEENYSAALAISEMVDELSNEDIEIETTKIKNKEKTASKVKKELSRKIHREKIAASLEENQLIVTEKKYRVIYADPPWSYGNSMPEYVTDPTDHYITMSTEDICAMPVKEIASKNSVLFLWSTSPHLPEALEVCKAWGFKYKTTFIWDKIKHNMGHYNSVRHEILLICVRGSCPLDVRKLFDSVVSIERTAHSEKPEFFREIIDTIYTEGNKIELFARVKKQNWDVYGNQV